MLHFFVGSILVVLCLWQHIVKGVGIVMGFILVVGMPCCDALTFIVLKLVLVPPIHCFWEHFIHSSCLLGSI